EIPGIGKSIAYAIETLLGGDPRTLRPVHVPARDQLRSLAGVGHRTAERLQDQGIDSIPGLPRLAEMRRRIEAAPQDEPATEDLLSADDDFRRLAGAGVLGRAAPRAFVPGGTKWEGVYRCERGGWALALSFADTALAHRLGKTRDWVTARFQRGGASGERTIVTETRGPLAGRRVVRGREEEGQAA
ncbi:MAG: helix-hairpin-helix domain-containing protein, partial [Gemmataceae bacterium]|nr:helix-hairpin-helix domain-containing protein [Gemmataceae bacterium]